MNARARSDEHEQQQRQDSRRHRAVLRRRALDEAKACGGPVRMQSSIMEAAVAGWMMLSARAVTCAKQCRACVCVEREVRSHQRV